MPVPENIPPAADFFGLTAPQFDALAASWGWPRFRAGQVRDWVYQKVVLDFAGMSNLSKRDREELPKRLSLLTSTIVSQQNSEDGTIKLLLTWPDGSNAETVMIPDGPRRTACISSQVGCPVGCHFCASGVNGVKGNLSAAQIVEQVYQLNRVMGAGSDGATERRSDKRGDGSARSLRRFVASLLRPSHQCPVCPNPRVPRFVLSSSSTSTNLTFGTGRISIWAIRMPRSTVNVCCPRLINGTCTSPR